jgi:MinD superfamily P-loop ATPase
LDYIIVDGSPVVGCPVISSITGANAVLAFTEPTLFGLHDMERVVALSGDRSRNQPGFDADVTGNKSFHDR